MQPGRTPGPLDTPAGRLATANAGFSLGLYQQLGKSDPSRNLFFSPGSISVAMAMTYLGAKENTAAEMRKVLNFEGIADDELHSNFAQLLQAYQKGDHLTLHMANRLFAEQTFSITDKYLADTQKSYGAELAKVDFRANYEAAREIINKWVEDKTANRIQNLIPSGALDPLTRLVLVNAVYFKGDWDLKFDPAKTETADFTAADSSKVPVRMMYQKDKFTYGVNHALHTQALELKYAGNSMSLIILLPEDGKYRLFEDNVKLEDFLSCEKSFRMMPGRDVLLWLPRFKLEDSFSLGDTLASMGIKDLFSEGAANLSGIDASNNIFVSKVLHKAFLEVNEEGSEAAAATAVLMQARMMTKEFRFRADKPFMFFIRENTTRSILFMGRLMKPAPE